MHETPALAAAHDAAQSNDRPPAHSAEVIALQAKLIADEAHPIVRPLRTEETMHQRWKRARALEADIASGKSPTDEELLWLGGYRAGPEYRGLALTYDVKGTGVLLVPVPKRETLAGIAKGASPSDYRDRSDHA